MAAACTSRTSLAALASRTDPAAAAAVAAAAARNQKFFAMRFARLNGLLRLRGTGIFFIRSAPMRSSECSTLVWQDAQAGDLTNIRYEVIRSGRQAPSALPLLTHGENDPRPLHT